MFVHSVYFWLREELSKEQLTAFRRGLESLAAVEVAEAVHVGTAAGTDRPVIDRSYSFGLVVMLRDRKAHDVYQDHPVHRRFVQEFSTFWTRIVIYDFA